MILRRQSYPLVLLYPKILHPPIEIEIFLGPPVTLPPLHGLDPIDGHLLTILVPLGPLPFLYILESCLRTLDLLNEKVDPYVPASSWSFSSSFPRLVIALLSPPTALDLELHSLSLAYITTTSASSI